MREQSERARAAWKGSGEQAPAEVYGEIAARVQPAFSGYTSLEATTRLSALIRAGSEVEEVVEGDVVEVVVERTPFYAESGGQVGDQGVIEGPDGRIEVEDTQKPVDGLIVHVGRVSLGRLRRGEEVELRVAREKRAATVRNHSGTHLFHWALRKVLGPQVAQAGSLVTPDRLRFDFTHGESLSDQQVREVEDLVNSLILQNLAGSVEEKSYPEALEEGAMAIFEEKYGDTVRVVSFGPSTELCGGTHASSTGEIGCFRILSQSAVGAGIRRIEAQTGFGVIEQARVESELLGSAARVLRVTPQELPDRIRKLLERQRELERELEQTRAKLRRGGSDDPMREVQEIAGQQVIAAEVSDVSPKELRVMVDELKQRIGSGVILLATRREGKVALAIGVTSDLSERFKAGALIQEVAAVVGGAGGGRPDFAQAGGPEVDALPDALARLRELIAAAAG